MTLKIAENEHPDLILLDGNMPYKTGYEICKTLKNNPLYKHIIIIFVTGDNKRNLANKVGADDYIDKLGMTGEILLSTIKKHLK